MPVSVAPGTARDRIGASGTGDAEPRRPPAPVVPQSDDALNLGATVLPVLVKNYWKPAAAGAVIVAVIVWLISR